MPILSWLTRDDDLKAAGRAPYRLLEEDPSLGYGDRAAGNMLIQGDNLEALKALLPFYAGRVKCIYIDPPYNTRSAFKQYDDNLEHSLWLAKIWPRLELLRELLSEDGSIWVSIDDNEGHYLKVVMDEVFGRKNFILDISWKKRDGPPNDRNIAGIHEHILVWGKHSIQKENRTIAEDNFNLMARTEKSNAQYQVFDEPSGPDSRGPFRKIDTTANGKGGRFVQSLFYPVTNPYTGEDVWPRQGTCWRHSQVEMVRLQADKRLFWGAKGTAKTPMRKLFLSEAKQGMTTPSIWDEVGYNQHASAEMEAIFGEKAAFETPKPEGLLERIIHIASNPGDLVLDSFLGSGTTAAVAQKMGRRYIGIEMGDHAVTHCAPRLTRVIDGEQGGISKSVDWTGGGGFRFYRLGAPVFDESGRLNDGIAFDVLAGHVWFSEIGAPWDGGKDGPVLGVTDKRTVALLYNGVLGDKRPEGGNVLTRPVLTLIREAMARMAPGFDGDLTVYGERSALTPASLERERITFKQTPYDVKARR
jgi:adenine-specific DNA-methyltransferase